MKLISLNVNAASQGEVFFNFIREQKETVDIFCFQEVFSATPGVEDCHSPYHLHLFQELSETLKDFNGFYSPKHYGYDMSGLPIEEWATHGQAMFVRNTLSVQSFETQLLVHNGDMVEAHPAEGTVIAQIMKMSEQSKAFGVINFHGISRPGSKEDTEFRIMQSRRLLQCVRRLESIPTIVCGDFNLYPHTESIALMGNKLTNLIEQYKIENTRNEISWKKFDTKQHFADYAFVSSGLNVNSFEVPYNLVSDHLPMIMEFVI